MKIRLTLLAVLLAGSSVFAGTRMDIVNARCKTVGEAMAVMHQQTNKPFVANGRGDDGFDNVGLALFLFKQLGIDLPEDMLQMSELGKVITKIPKMQPGDIVFFGNPQNKKEIYRMGIVQSVSIDGLSFTLFYADEKDGIVRIAHSSEDAFNGRFKQANRIVSDSELNNVRAEHEKDLANIEKAKANLVKAQSAVVAAEEALKAMEDTYAKKNEDPITVK
ncbi:MAG: C40 family peptidase [Paludibacteraceae bacterium]|nr:C40 family peptidase [Paludibacteraceae bacterium]